MSGADISADRMAKRRGGLWLVMLAGAIVIGLGAVYWTIVSSRSREVAVSETGGE